jgi:hypothetical protein
VCVSEHLRSRGDCCGFPLSRSLSLVSTHIVRISCGTLERIYFNGNEYSPSLPRSRFLPLSLSNGTTNMMYQRRMMYCRARMRGLRHEIQRCSTCTRDAAVFSSASPSGDHPISQSPFASPLARPAYPLPPVGKICAVAFQF